MKVWGVVFAIVYGLKVRQFDRLGCMCCCKPISVVKGTGACVSYGALLHGEAT